MIQALQIKYHLYILFKYTTDEFSYIINLIVLKKKRQLASVDGGTAVNGSVKLEAFKKYLSCFFDYFLL